MLEQALLNVVRNAIEYTETGGSIVLACTGADDEARMTITDDGSGIKPEDIERVFDRFYRAGGPRPVDGGGSGLGLSIARQLLDQHAGSIQAIPGVQRGASFLITLPLTAPPE